MNDFYLDLDRHQNSLDRIRPVAKRLDGAHFAELWWSAEDSGGDMIGALVNTQDVYFETKTRMFALGLIKQQLRYWAGPKPDAEKAYNYEAGSFESIELALRLAEKYLVDAVPLKDIAIPRSIQPHV